MNNFKDGGGVSGRGGIGSMWLIDTWWMIKLIGSSLLENVNNKGCFDELLLPQGIYRHQRILNVMVTYECWRSYLKKINWIECSFLKKLDNAY